MFYTYVLRSKDSGRLFIGSAINRINLMHQCGMERWSFMYFEAIDNKEKAVRREKYFRSFFGRQYIDQISKNCEPLIQKTEIPVLC